MAPRRTATPADRLIMLDAGTGSYRIVEMLVEVWDQAGLDLRLAPDHLHTLRRVIDQWATAAAGPDRDRHDHAYRQIGARATAGFGAPLPSPSALNIDRPALERHVRTLRRYRWLTVVVAGSALYRPTIGQPFVGEPAA